VATDTFTRLLARPALAPLAGRLALRLRIAPLSAEGADAFVEHAFDVAGMTNILVPTGVGALHTAAAGSPRQIGALMAAAMQRALEKGSKMITDEILQEILDGQSI
jgi:general secretion pathway protein A